MRKIRIGILADGGDAGGGRRHILTLCEQMPSDCVTVSFFSLGEGALSHSVEKLTTIQKTTYPLRSKMDLSLPSIIRRWVKDHNIDILHTHGLKANMYGRIALLKSSIPIVTTYHSNPLYDYSSRVLGIVFSIIDQWTLHVSTQYIAVSYEVATQLIRRGVSRERIHIVKNGVPLHNKIEPADAATQKQELRKTLQIPPHACVVGSLGRLVRVKGYDETLRVFAFLKKHYEKVHTTPVHLLLIGGGELEARLKKRCKDLGIEQSVHFVGFQQHPQPYIVASDVMLFTPKSEALGIAILESMNAGVPVVAKKVGGIRELIINEYNGSIYSSIPLLSKAVISLLESKEKQNAFIKNGHKMIQQYFSNDTMIDKTEHVYRDILKDSVPISSISVSGKPKDQILSELSQSIESTPHCKHVVTLNIEMLAKASREKKVWEAIQQADLVLPDGMSIVALAKIQQSCFLERIPGIEFSTDLLQIAHQKNWKVFFVGGKKDILPSLQTFVQRQYPGITIAGMHNGYFQSHEESSLVQEIQKTQPDILLVALGMGKQECFIARWKDQLPCKIAIGVGGSFDVWSGQSKRSPQWWIDHKLEWLYRALKEPKQRFTRILSTVPFYLQQHQVRFSQKKIVLSGYYGFGNIGDEAILRTLMRDLSLLKKKGYPLDISVLSANPYSTSTLTDAFAIERFSFFSVLEEIFRCDALISGGGGLIQDITSFKSPLYYLGIIQIARFFRKPVFIYANGIGPLHHAVNRFLCKIVFNQCTAITLRDEASRQLVDQIGVRPSIVTVTVDPIFSLRPEHAFNIDSYPHHDNFIAICFGPNPQTNSKIEDIATFLDDVGNTTKLPLVFTPFYPDYDKKFSILLQQKMKYPSHLIDTFNTPEDMLSLLRRCQFGIGMRLHFMILLSLLKKPILPFIYDPKVKTFAHILHLTPVLTKNDNIVTMKNAFHRFYQPNSYKIPYTEEVVVLQKRNLDNFIALESFVKNV
ncbi:MAG: polysaccharide pyruvyl transferase CsaB [Caldisericia bacterium]|nr:polysaccharide pyruvyl transferase CsaB [Caldisericia bacterium]